MDSRHLLEAQLSLGIHLLWVPSLLWPSLDHLVASPLSLMHSDLCVLARVTFLPLNTATEDSSSSSTICRTGSRKSVCPVPILISECILHTPLWLTLPSGGVKWKNEIPIYILCSPLAPNLLSLSLKSHTWNQYQPSYQVEVWHLFIYLFIYYLSLQLPLSAMFNSFFRSTCFLCCCPLLFCPLSPLHMWSLVWTPNYHVWTCL